MIFSSAVLVSPSTITQLVKKSIRAGKTYMFVRTRYGCECETVKLVEALRRDEYFDYIAVKGTRILVSVGDRKRSPRSSVTRSIKRRQQTG